MDSEGQYGGLIAIWNPRKCKLTPYKTREGILLEGIIQGFKETIRLFLLKISWKKEANMSTKDIIPQFS